jgi:ADP-ribose pyrophosphatase YjhB (NUDIX family)
MYATSLGYAQMRPKGVESNHFAYHLDQLIRAGLIAKDGRSYTLTPLGLSLADRVSHENMTIRTQPHIVTAANVVNGDGQLLLYKHTFQPYLGLYGFPQGRLHFEEQVATAAKRELQEKSGLEKVKLAHRGIAYVHAKKGEETISRILIHVFSGEVKGTPELPAPTEKGASSWGDPSKLKAEECMPGFPEIRKLLAKHDVGELFFAEIETQMA